MSIHELILNAQGFLGRNLKDVQSSEEQELFRVARAALSFISETGAVYPFEDYLRVRKDAPPYAVASFKTREDAEAWLKQHAEPPHGAFVLIEDDYYIVMYVRELNDRRLFRHPILEGYLDQLQRTAPSGTLVAFDRREEAMAWLRSQPESSQRTYLLIAGQRHVALYHHNINHYALYSLSERSEKQKAAAGADEEPHGD
jgi:hypothetical protein